MENIKRVYENLTYIPSDINEHLSTLCRYAQECDSIFETGVRGCVSSWALTYGLLNNNNDTQKTLLLNDIRQCDVNHLLLEASTENIKIDCVWKNNLEMEIDTAYNEESALTAFNEMINSSGNISQREELKFLEGAVELNKTVLKMNQHFWYPKLNGYFNLGSQSQSWEFNNKSAYYLGGLQLDVPLFTGKRNQYKIKQTQLDITLSQNNLKQTTQQLNLVEKIAKNNLQTAFQNYNVSLKQIETAETYQRLIDRGYREGVNTYLETVDARSQFMNASQMKNINLFKVLIAAAEYEREIASFNIQSK
jgi:hypothetical protein